MKKTFLLFFVALLISVSTDAQTLFTYGNKKTEVAEFLKAYNKVYPEGSVNADKEKSIREYLRLYINSKLKIHDAYSKRYDTMPDFKDELNNLRYQVVENYMTDPESYNSLLNEAFERSQKDIQVQHIYIPFKLENNVHDTAAAKSKIDEAYKELSSGKSFDEVALKYSADPAVTSNKGNLGFITVFSLPYQFENIVYGLMPGKYSTVYISNSGFHIFKNISERKAIGKIKTAHILLAVPAGSDEELKLKNAKLADSLYQRLSQGDDFAELARVFSNDYISAASGGLIPEFSVGTFDPQFENAVINLPLDGNFSKPFLTSHGYHIVKRIGIAAPAAVKDKKTLDNIKVVLDKDARVEITHTILIERVIAKAGLKTAELDLKKLSVYVDSLADLKQAPPGNTFNNEMPLLKIGDIERNIGDLINYAQTNRWLPNFAGIKPLSQLMDEFKQQTALEYYKKHLEEFNADFRQQMLELKDGNLFFDNMMKEVWSRAQTDSVGQMNYYKQHVKKYTWTNSADVVIFYCGDEGTANNLRPLLLSDPVGWTQRMEDFNDRSTFDSGRFEFSRIPGLSNTIAKEGMITEIEKNADDNSAAFAYIIKIYNQPEQKSFTDAKSEVITDYQEELDTSWIAALRKKYPVVIDQKVLNSILK